MAESIGDTNAGALTGGVSQWFADWNDMARDVSEPSARASTLAGEMGYAVGEAGDPSADTSASSRSQESSERADRAGGMRAARAANGFSPPKLDAKLTTVRAR